MLTRFNKNQVNSGSQINKKMYINDYVLDCFNKIIKSNKFI